MKRNLLLLLLFMPFLTLAQKDFKLVEQSQKEKPNWLVNGNYKDALMVQANRMATLDDAQKTVMSSILHDCLRRSRL